MSKVRLKIKRPEYKCPRCNENLTRTKRGSLVKFFLFWLPIRRYYCKRCLKTRYVFAKKPTIHRAQLD